MFKLLLIAILNTMVYQDTHCPDPNGRSVSIHLGSLWIITSYGFGYSWLKHNIMIKEIKGIPTRGEGEKGIYINWQFDEPSLAFYECP